MSRDAPPQAPAPGLAPGSTFGRYLIIDELGAGGMGVVLRAYDPVLHREVALKALRPGRLTVMMRARLVREAQAMAKLSHPNVVSVHDVEVQGETVVLVMEYVEGATLKTWQKENTPSPEEIVELYLAAGQGLAAAHRAGLLHRDFKPSNVLVSREGVVKVTDFGLARAATGHGEVGTHDPPLESPLLASAPEDLASGDPLTRQGMVMGTPAFMAPEQIRGKDVGPAVDQYAFCTALWAALNRTMPFPGSRRLDATSLAAREAGPPAWPRGSSVPRRWSDAIRRGLAPDSKDRWPDLDALLAELRHDPRRQRRRWLMAGAGALAIGLVGAGVTAATGAAARACSGAEEKLSGIWDAARAARVEEAFSKIHRSYATQALAAANAALDGYARDWVAMHGEACEATTLRGEQSTAVMDLRMACLHRAATELEATVDQLAEADEEVVARAHDLTASLPPLTRCADVEALMKDVEPPLASQAAAVDDVRAHLARARAHMETGHYERSRSVVEKAREALADVDYAPLMAEFALREGLVLEKLGEFDGAEAKLTEAFAAAAEAQQWREMHASMTALSRVVGYEQRRMDEGLRYAELAAGLTRGEPLRQAAVSHSRGTIYMAQARYDYAEAELRRALDLRSNELEPDHPQITAALNNLGGVLLSGGDYDEAEAIFRRTLELETVSLGPDHPDLALPQSNLAGVLHAQGKYEEAEAGFRRALAIKEAALGSQHVSLGLARLNIGTALQEQGRHAEAEAEYRWALDHMESALGPEHPHVTMARNNLAVALETQGRFEEAVKHQREALAVAEKVQGPEHPNVASSLNNLAAVLLKQGEIEAAEAAYRRSLAIREQSLGADHPHTAQSRNSLGLLLMERGARDEAEEQLRRALRDREAALPPDHVDVTKSRHDLAELLLSRGKIMAALPLAEAAWERRKDPEVPPGDRAETAFVLARALWAMKRSDTDRQRARDLAARAIELFGQTDPPDPTAAGRVRAWRDESGAGPKP